MTPSGVGSPPSGGSGWLARLAVNSTLSCPIRAPRSDGAFPPKVRRKRDRTLVSSQNRPSPSPRMSPKASATTKVSSLLSTKRCSGTRGSPAWASSAVGSAANPAGSLGKGGDSHGPGHERGLGRDRRAEVGVVGQPPVEVDIVAGHHRRGEAPLEDGADAVPIEAGPPLHGRHRLVLRRDHKAGHAVVDDLRHGAAAPGDDRGA